MTEKAIWPHYYNGIASKVEQLCRFFRLRESIVGLDAQRAGHLFAAKGDRKTPTD